MTTTDAEIKSTILAAITRNNGSAINDDLVGALGTLAGHPPLERFLHRRHDGLRSEHGWRTRFLHGCQLEELPFLLRELVFLLFQVVQVSFHVLFGVLDDGEGRVELVECVGPVAEQGPGEGLVG